MKVTAALGIQMPMEHKPHDYITDAESVEVPASAYYLRALADGDLVAVAAGAKNNAKKGGD